MENTNGNLGGSDLDLVLKQWIREFERGRAVRD
jgi:hypothetical protein